MTTYKRGIFSLIFGILASHFAVIIIAVIADYFLSRKITIILTLVAYIFMMYLTIFSENIKFVVDDEKKIFSYYQNGKLVKEYNLKGARLGYDMTTKKNQGATKIELLINEDKIDCQPLGQMKFYKMYGHLEALAEVEPEKIEVERAGE